MITDHPFRLQWLAAGLLASIVGSAAWGKDPQTTQRLQFKKGASSIRVEGRIKGYETVDYLVGARQGQSANISLASKHTATYFNILAPGKTDEAFFDGSMNDNQFEGALPATGDYRIRVYMMRAAARRNEVANYGLEVAIGATLTSAAAGAARPSIDAQVPGTDFHATGDLPCTVPGGPERACHFGVKRAGQGSGTVVITKPDGSQRIILFEKGKATGYDASQADPGKFSAQRESDNTIVRIGGERYEIADAVIHGG